MNLHEYQGKQLFAEYGLPVSKGFAVDTPDQAADAADAIGGDMWVVKAQVHAGGRGKAGGVKLLKSKDEIRAFASHWLGRNLVTYQTDEKGQPVSKILVESCTDIASELYLGAVVDRGSRRIVFMASSEGGVEIEKVAHETPEKIFKVFVDPAYGIADFQVRQLIAGLGLTGAEAKGAAKLIRNLYTMFWETDASMVEVNPLITTPTGEVLALDAKVSFDSNALYRHPEITALRDLNEEDPKEIEASKFSLSYIALDGNIACLVNGAGLAMSTMDIIKHFGGSPANFLDVGGGATKDQVVAAFKIILGDANVKGIFVNIFGGIMDCNVIATGIIEAVREVGLKLPLVVRLEGNNVTAGKATLASSGLPIVSGDTMADAARKIVQLVA
jgi:succinyl-CoA synthetase beta subunit